MSRVNDVSLQCRRDVEEVKFFLARLKKKEGERKHMRQAGGWPVHWGLMKPWEEKVCLYG